MSERLHDNHHESKKHSQESLDDHAVEHHRQNAEKAHEKHALDTDVHRTIEQHAQSAAHYKQEHSAPHHERPHHYITSSVKKGVYKYTMDNVQSHLSPSERRFSKIVHNESVETLSELGASTIGRSSAIVGGGVFMVVGGITLLVMARYFGFSIPLSSLIALYIIGFLGIAVVDHMVKLFKKSQLKRNRH